MLGGDCLTTVDTALWFYALVWWWTLSGCKRPLFSDSWFGGYVFKFLMGRAVGPAMSDLYLHGSPFPCVRLLHSLWGILGESSSGE